jgi:Rrf2 family protein
MGCRKDKVVSVTELVKSLSIPRPFLRKILQRLGKKGLVESHKGVGGGFRLTRPPDDIYLTELIEAFQGPVKLNKCIFRKKICPNTRVCTLKARIDRIEGRLEAELNSISIRSLLKG